MLRRGDQFLNADNLKYDQETDTYVADGNVRYQDGTMRVIAARAHGDQNTDTHKIEDVQYQLVSRSRQRRRRKHRSRPAPRAA